MKKLLYGFLLFFSLTSGQLLANTAYDSIVVNNLLDTHTSWSDEVLPNNTRVTIREFIIQPGEKTAIHKHLVNGGGIILDGEITMYETTAKDGSFTDKTKLKKIVAKKGDTWSESIDRWHYGVNEGNKPVHFLITFIGDKDVAIATPKK